MRKRATLVHTLEKPAARQGRAGHGRAGQGQTRQGRAGQGGPTKTSQPGGQPAKRAAGQAARRAAERAARRAAARPPGTNQKRGLSVTLLERKYCFKQLASWNRSPMAH